MENSKQYQNDIKMIDWKKSEQITSIMKEKKKGEQDGMERISFDDL